MYSCHMNDENRLQAIETTLMHQARQIEDLSDIVVLQAKELDTLKRKLSLTHERLETLRVTMESGEKALSVTEEALLNKPPHY